MKHLLLTTIVAVVLVGCGPNIHDAAEDGNIEAVKQHLADGADVNAEGDVDGTGFMQLPWAPLHLAATRGHKEVAELLIDNGAANPLFPLWIFRKRQCLTP